MTSRALRYLLLTLFVGLSAVAAYAWWDRDVRARTASEAGRTFDEAARTAARALLDLRHAQSGYVAVGQGENFWTARVDALLGSSREALASLDALARTADARGEVEAAADAFDDFQQMDKRARNYARNGQRLLASDLVFSDGLDRIELALAALERAARAERAALDSTTRDSRRAQMLALAGALLGGLVIAIMLAPMPATGATTPAAGNRSPPLRTPEPARSLPPKAAAPRTSPTSAASTVRPPAPPPPAPVADAQVARPAPEVDLPGIASLCTELARVLDMQALPPALARAAGLLHATGVVVWIADPDGRELAPVIAHGYAPHIVARMGTIGREDENVTAAAFRTGLLQVVDSGDGSNGAIAAPLVTATGPVGVLAAEVSQAGISADSSRAAAAIVAAQLSTLVGPPAARSAQGAAGTAGG